MVGFGAERKSRTGLPKEQDGSTSTLSGDGTPCNGSSTVDNALVLAMFMQMQTLKLPLKKTCPSELSN